MSEDIKRNCNTCKFGMFGRCDTLKNNEQYQKIKDNGLFDKWEFKENFVCNNYKSKYIEYPIEVSKINRDTNISGSMDDEIGKFVRIRPCAEEYQGKTYLGLYLGKLPVGFQISHNSKTKELNIKFDTNPAIFVFALKKIIYGYESWWEFIDNEGELKEITDNDIENVWYVKVLKVLEKKDENE